MNSRHLKRIFTNNPMIKIQEIIQQSLELKQRILQDSILLGTIQKVSEKIIETYRNDGKVLLCGNGGSAADAQHIAAELSGRFYIDRPPLNAEALHVNTSFLTAIANDYSFAKVYSRSVEAFGKKGDILMAFSTSGNSENIVNASIKANEIGMTVIAFTGHTGGKLKDHCAFLINIPSAITPRIQEAHILTGHIICEIIENEIFSRP
jgi:D-sedoheptulose 7-phosphate isomerase